MWVHFKIYFKMVDTMPCKFHLNKDKQQNLPLLVFVRMQSVRIFVATWTLRSFYFKWGERFKRLDMIHRRVTLFLCTLHSANERLLVLKWMFLEALPQPWKSLMDIVGRENQSLSMCLTHGCLELKMWRP